MGCESLDSIARFACRWGAVEIACAYPSELRPEPPKGSPSLDSIAGLNRASRRQNGLVLGLDRGASDSGQAGAGYPRGWAGDPH